MEHMKPIFNAKPIHWSYWIAISGLWLGMLLTNNGPNGMNWGPIVRYAGQISWYLLTFTVFISVLARLFPTTVWLGKLQALRKHTGLAGFLFALMHIIAVYLIQSSFGKTLGDFFSAILSDGNSMLLAWLGFLFLLPAFLTSCAWAIKKLGFKKWKFLQRLVHPAYVFAALHIGFLPFFRGGQPDYEPLVTVGLLIVGYSALLFKYRRKKI
jgi:sulfoxide reductase heme-binding subunit YedZ